MEKVLNTIRYKHYVKNTVNNLRSFTDPAIGEIPNIRSRNWKGETTIQTLFDSWPMERKNGAGEEESISSNKECYEVIISL